MHLVSLSFINFISSPRWTGAPLVIRLFFIGTSIRSLMSYSLDAYTYSFLNHEGKTCDDIGSRRILAQLVDPTHLTNYIFPAFGPFFRPVLTCVLAHHYRRP